MQIEDRLYALAAQARQQYGEAFLRDPAQLTPRLSSQAPDLYAEIRVLAALLAEDAPGKIAAAADPAAEEARLATEIAGRERVSISVFGPALAVARRLGPVSAATSTTAGGWAGDSVIVGAPAPAAPIPAYAPQPTPTPSPAPAPGVKTEWWKNRWVQGAAVGVALLVGYQFMQGGQNGMQGGGQTPTQQGPGGPDQGPNQGPGQGPGQGPNQGPNQGPGQGPGQGPTNAPGGGQGGAPLLVSPNGQLPTLPVQIAQDGSFAVAFRLPIQGGQVNGMVLLPRGGWQAGYTQIGFARSENGQLDSLGAGTLQLVNSRNGVMRAMQPQWQQDNIGFGQICLAFANGQNSQQQQEVVLEGSTMCVMDSSCTRAAACGRMQ